MVAKIREQLQHPALLLVFDAANLVMQGYTADEVLSEFRTMLPGLGWLHVKDYRRTSGTRPAEYVDEEGTDGFVPAGAGDGAHAAIFREVAAELPRLTDRCRTRGTRLLRRIGAALARRRSVWRLQWAGWLRHWCSFALPAARQCRHDDRPAILS